MCPVDSYLLGSLITTTLLVTGASYVPSRRLSNFYAFKPLLLFFYITLLMTDLVTVYRSVR